MRGRGRLKSSGGLWFGGGRAKLRCWEIAESILWGNLFRSLGNKSLHQIIEFYFFREKLLQKKKKTVWQNLGGCGASFPAPKSFLKHDDVLSCQIRLKKAGGTPPLQTPRALNDPRRAFFLCWSLLTYHAYR